VDERARFKHNTDKEMTLLRLDAADTGRCTTSTMLQSVLHFGLALPSAALQCELVQLRKVTSRPRAC
jgi:hypothetical protein